MDKLIASVIEQAIKAGYAEGYRDALQKRPFKYYEEAMKEIQNEKRN